MDELSQEVLDVVVRGEADSDGDGTLDPVHAESLVETSDDALLPVNFTQCRPDRQIPIGTVCRHAGGLHSPSDNVQWIAGRLSNDAGRRTEQQRYHSVWSGVTGECEILLLESIVREEGHPSVRDDPQDGRPVPPVERPRSLALPNLDEHLAQRPVAGVLVRDGHPRPRQIQRVGQRLRGDARQRSRQEPSHFGIFVLVDLQQLPPLFVRRELDRRVGNDAGHRSRVAPPEGHEALLGVRIAQKCQRRSERVGDVFVDLKVDLGPIEGGDRGFGQCSGDCSRNQTGEDYISIVESLVRVGDCDSGVVATAATATTASTTTTAIANAVT